MLKIKLFAVFAFIACASCAFLFSSSRSQAQAAKTSVNRDRILEKVAGYKNWKQVQKPAAKPDLSALRTDSVLIYDSAPMG